MFTNTTGATQCVTIDTNTVCNGDHSIMTAAYLGSFDPNNVCTNWIGDAGVYPNPDQAFQVEVNSGQTLVVVVSEAHHAGCPDYTLTITGLGCPGHAYPNGNGNGNALCNAHLHTRRWHTRAVDAGSAGRGRSLRRVHGQRWHLRV